MPNMMDYLRLQNIFGPNQPIGNDLPEQGGITGTMRMPTFGDENQRPDRFGNLFQAPNMAGLTTQVAAPEDTNIMDIMNKLYTPESAATQRYEQLLGQYPKAEDYHPSVGRRIGGALTAIGQSFDRHGFRGNPLAIKQGLDLMDQPYTEKLSDWKNQIGPAQQAATNERYQNANERMYANAAAQGILRENAAKDKNTIEQQKLDIQRDRNRIMDLKRMMPSYQFDFSGPTVKVGNKTTGQSMDTGVPTGHFSDKEKMDLQQTQAIERIQETGEQARQTEGTRQDNREALAWSEPYAVDMADGTKQWFQTSKADGTTRPVQFPAGAKDVTKIGTPPKAGTTVQPKNIEAIKQKAQETIEALDQLVDPKTQKFQPNMSTAVGKSRMFGLQMIPGSKTYSSDVAVKRAKDMVTLELLQELKAQSKTGATGFGQLNMKELGVLESAASKLDPSLDEASFIAEVKRIREKLELILKPDDGTTPSVTPGGGPAKSGTGKSVDDYINAARGGK